MIDPRSTPWRSYTGIAAVALAALVLAVWWLDDERPAGSDTPPDAGRTASGATTVDGADEPSPAPAEDVASSAGAVRTAPAADGYSVVRHRGRMVEGGTMARGVDVPPAGPDWLRAGHGPERLAAAAAGVSGRPWTFGYVELASAAGRAALESSLRDAGAWVVGSSGRLVRARLPGDIDALRDIAALPEVAGLGAVPTAAKLRGFDAGGGAESDAGLPVFVTVMEEDGDGEWGRRLQALGADVGDYDADTRAYTATATREVIGLLAESDFVAAVEPVRRVTALNDTAVPAMGADALRSRDFASPGAFTGVDGGSVAVGVMDTGLNLNHPDIGSGRESVCGTVLPWPAGRADELVEAEDLWIDSQGHGTHVTGTILGSGVDDPRFAGMAPGVPHIRFAKSLDRFGDGTDDTIRRGMDYLARVSGCGGADTAKAKPHIVNMSLGGSSRSWSGRTAGERKLDATVWSRGQLYVVSQGNAAESGFSDYAAAKNSLAVGAVHDTGGHATFTSVGPTADGRLAPQVVGTGVHVHSARGQGKPGGYDRRSGTSMAAPSVAGVAALLMDALPSHRDNPALARARLMASAIRPDAWLDDPAAFPLDNTDGPGWLQNVYGMGKVSAHTAVLDGDNAQGWRSGSATAEPEDGEYAYVDIEVPAGASRLDLVLTWDEPPADAVAGSSVLNDLDLWLDRDADCAAARCGEHSSRSRVDNVEWIIVRDPAPGTYRAKVAAEAVYTAAPRAALAWTVIRGPSTPQLAMRTTEERLPADRTSEFRAVVSADGYVAAGALLRVDCFSATDGCDGLDVESVALAEDGGGLRQLEVPASLDDRQLSEGVFFGSWFSLGEVHRGGGGSREDVEVVLRVRTGADPATLRLAADSWNASAAVATVAVAGAPPSAAARPANDDFAAAARIDGAEGSADPALWRATSEPGEPMLAAPPFVRRAAASVWYEWTAPESATYHFAVSRRDGALSRRAHVDVYEGPGPVSLRRIGGSLVNVSIPAEEGLTYRVRVASYERVEPLTLRWSSGRPANDDFAAAVRLEDASGEVAGTTVGATLEPGESWGSLAGTVWYRWTAPEDGDWAFQGIVRTEDGGAVSGHPRVPRLLLFRGGSIGTLRLASTYPGHPDRYFTARAGEEFRIAAAATGPGSASAFDLEWRRTTSKPVDNDAFAEAESLSGGSSSATVRVDFASTVEPGEPAETGVRTRWWKWDAPADRRYTWRLEDRGEYPWRAGIGIPGFQVRAFRGGSIGELDLLGGAGPFAPYEFAVDLLAGETLRISAGFAPDGSEAYDVRSASVDLAWGPTPDNDGVDGAPLLDSASGSRSGTNRYATTGAGDRSDIVGRSAVWWTFEAPADGWYRFSADGAGWAVAVHDAGGAGIVAASRWQRAEGAAAVLFYAQAGSRHGISLGSVGGSGGGDFTLRWGTAEAPVWLRYAGRLADGDRSREDGGPVEIRRPGDLAILPDGAPWRRSALYLASGIGLAVFSRDPASGDLTQEQLAGGDLSGSHLAVDAGRSRLLAHDCGTWRSYGLSADGAAGTPTDLTVANDPANCGWLLQDGDAVYRIGAAGVDAFDIEQDGSLEFADTEAVAGLKGAAVGSPGRLYAAGADGLVVIERDDADGSLSATDAGQRFAVTTAPRMPLAVDPDAARLYAVDDDGTHVFALTDPLAPVRIATLPRSRREHVGSWLRDEDWCGWAAMRGAFALDVFCGSQTFSAAYRPDAGELAETDRMDDRTPDRFNNLVPEFGLPAGMAASPDGRHVYVSTAQHGILVFERVGGRSEDSGSGVSRTAFEESVPAGYESVTLGDSGTVWGIPELHTSDSRTGTVAYMLLGANHGCTFANAEADRSSKAFFKTEALGDHTSFESKTVCRKTSSRWTTSFAGERMTNLRVFDPGSPTNVREYTYNANTGAYDESTPRHDEGGGGGSTDDHGDTFADATSVAVPSTTDGELEERGDRDYFRLVVDEAATLTVGTTGSTDTYGTLFDGDETSLETDDDGGAGSNFEIEREVAAGTYYVEVRGYRDSRTGTYELEVEVSGGGSTAPDLVVESPSVDDGAPDAGDRITFSATVRNRGAGTSASTTLRYYRSSDSSISSGDTQVGTDFVSGLAGGSTSAESISLTAPSAAGTYYYGACVDTVSGESDTTNNCSTGVEVEVSSAGGSTDDHGDTFADATSVAVPSSTDGELEERGDRDYFRLVVDEAATLTVGTTGSTDTYGTLFDGDETSLETDDDGGATGRNFEIEREVVAGTYYVEVRGFNDSRTGTYELEVSADAGSGADMFGALSFNLLSCTDVPVGLALDRDTEQAALDAAVDACVDDGGSRTSCRNKSNSFQRCGVITHALLPRVECTVQNWIVEASTRSAAEGEALSRCRRNYPGYTCTVLENDAGENMSGCNSTSGSSSATATATTTAATAVRLTRSVSIDDRSRNSKRSGEREAGAEPGSPDRR